MEDGNKLIGVVGYKPFTVPADPMYRGIQVGQGVQIPGMLRGNTLDNNADKNDTYYELTAQYWIWKNSDDEIKGLAHYRRILGGDGRKAKLLESISTRRQKTLSGKENERLLQQYDVILSKMHNYVTEDALEHYQKNHVIGSSFDVIRQHVQESFPECVEPLDGVLHGKQSHLFNILIARKEILLDAYSEGRFTVLGYVEQNVDISGLSKSVRRIFGYLRELLLHVWIQANGLSRVDIFLLFLEHHNLPRRYMPGARRKLGVINLAEQERIRMQNAGSR